MRVITFKGPRIGAYELDYINISREYYESLGFNETDLTYLLDVFDKIDFDGSGTISCEEFLDFLDQPDTPFARTVCTVHCLS